MPCSSRCSLRLHAAFNQDFDTLIPDVLIVVNGEIFVVTCISMRAVA